MPRRQHVLSWYQQNQAQSQAKACLKLNITAGTYRSPLFFYACALFALPRPYAAECADIFSPVRVMFRECQPNCWHAETKNCSAFVLQTQFHSSINKVSKSWTLNRVIKKNKSRREKNTRNRADRYITANYRLFFFFLNSVANLLVS